MKHKITIFDSGRLEGLSEGTLELMDLNYEREGDFSITAHQSEITLKAEYTLYENSDFHLGGSILTQAEKIKGLLSKQNKFGVDNVIIELEDLNLALAADNAFQISSKIHTTLDIAEYSGTIQLSVGTLLDILKYIQSLSARKNTTLEQKQLADKLDGEISTPHSDIKAKKIISNSLFNLKSAGGDVLIETAGSTEGSEINFSANKRTTTIKSLRSELKSLNLKTSEDEVSIDLIGNTHGNDYRIKGPIGEARVQKVETDLKECGVKIQPGKVAVEVSISALLDGNNFSTKKGKDTPQTNITASEIMATNKGTIVTTEEDMVWQSDLDFKLDGLDVSFDEGITANLKLSKFELKGGQANHNLEYKIESLLFSGLDIFISRQFIEEANKIRRDQPKNQDKYTGQNDLEPPSTLIKEIQKRLKAKGYYKGTIDGQMDPETEAAMNAFREVSGLPLPGFEDLLSALTDSSGVPITLRIGLFALVDGAKIHFKDDTVEPAVDIETTFQIAKILGFDTSDPTKRAKVRVQADINKFTQLELDGWVAGVSPKSNLNVQGKIENIELHTYSPYAAEFAGFMLDSGQLTLFINGISKEGSLDGLLNVELVDLDFAPLSADDLERFKVRVGLPIETLIGFLENNEGRIDLELPIEGTILKPAIDIKPAIFKGIGGVLKKVFPPTLVASILLSEGNGDMSFKSIEFSPGSKKMDSQAKTYADSILELLKQHPKLSLDFCGRSTYKDLSSKTDLPIRPPKGSDIEAREGSESNQESWTIDTNLLIKYEPEMIELAVDRTSAVRSYLINEKGADPARIAECRPYFDINDMGSPRVDITF